MLKMPAMGAKFLESGESICAVQYDAGATINYNPDGKQSYGYKAWMRKELVSKTRLVLAAAMSTFMVKQDSSAGTDD
jgi:hypothetical protein